MKILMADQEKALKGEFPRMHKQRKIVNAY